MHECARFANMSCQRLSIVSSFVSRVLLCNDIVESETIKLSLAKRFSYIGSRSFETKYYASKSLLVV
jgi:hypothetical protein